MHKLSKNLGETLLEALIAIMIIVIAVTASTSIVISALQTTGQSEDYLIAQNLSVEALEIVRNVRDTNWLKFPAAKESCWLVIDPAATTTCNPNLGDVLTYRVNFDFSLNRWIIEPVSTKDEIKLYQYNGEYVHKPNPQPAPPPDPDPYIPTKFSRKLTVEQEGTANVRLNIEVTWTQGAASHTLNTDEGLTNYLE